MVDAETLRLNVSIFFCFSVPATAYLPRASGLQYQSPLGAESVFLNTETMLILV